MEIIKEKVYSNILQFLSIEGYPSEGTSDFKGRVGVRRAARDWLEIAD